MDSLINNYNEDLFAGFNKIKPELIQCFIEYYGKKYENIIIERFNNTNFIFYCNESVLKHFAFTKKEYQTSNNYNLLFKDAKLIKSELTKQNKSCTNKIRALNRMIYSTKPKELLDEEFALYANNSIFKNKLTCMSTNKNNNEYEKFVFIPLFFTSDHCLIHEIIHSLVSQIIAISIDEQPIIKTGLIVGRTMESWYLEEAITDIEASKIYSILLSKSKSFLDNIYCRHGEVIGYNFIKPLVNEFYKFFKDEIIYSRFTLNKNLLVELCNKEEYESYSNIINECYRVYPTKKEFYEYQYISNSNTERMKEHKKQLSR